MGINKYFFDMNYDIALIQKLLIDGIFGALISNIFVPAIIIFILYDFLPASVLLLFFLSHVFTFCFRLYYHIKLRECISQKSKNINRYLFLYIVFIAISALLLGLSAWLSVLYDAPSANILIVAAIITAVISGAITTLGSVLISFLSYIFFSIIPLILALLYQGESIMRTFAGILCIYTIINILLSVKFYKSYKYSNELKKKFEILYDESFDGIALIKKHKIVECNDSLAKMFGYDTKKEFLTQIPSEYSPLVQTDGEFSTRKMLKMLKKAHRNTVSFEWLQRKKDGEVFWAEIVLTHIEINREKIIYGVWRNIDSRKKVEAKIQDMNQNLKKKVNSQLEDLINKDQQLQQQSRLAQMGEMISMIAHQWRQPLTAISATSGAINLKAQLNKLDKDTAIELSSKISDYSQHLSSTIDDFRDFFKSNKEKRETSFDEIIHSVLGIIEISITNKNIKITKELNSKDKFSSYPNELKQVIMNLIKNAEDILIEKEIQNPFIHIKTYKQEDKNILEVSDNGGGIPEDILPKIFDPYFSTKTKKDGTGLGLYMSKTIIEEHCKGSLSVSNDSQGVVFKIVLGDEDGY